MNRLDWSPASKIGLCFFFASILVVVVGFSPEAWCQGTGHVLFGDLKVKGADEVPVELGRTFQVLLKDGTSTRLVARDTVTAGGRYRFNGVGNGEYILEVLWGNQVVYEERFILMEFKKDDIRKDIELEYVLPERKPPPSTSVYSRPEEEQARFDEAQQSIQQGNPAAAIQLLEGVVNRDPLDYEAWTELGTAYFLRDEWRQAERCYRRASQAKVDFLPARVNLGKLLLTRKRYEEALEALTTAVELAPDRAETHYLLGEAYLGLKLGSRAVPCMEKALELDPEGMAEAHLRLAALYDAAGYRDRASDEYRRFLEQRPDFERRRELEEYIRRNSRPQP